MASIENSAESSTSSIEKTVNEKTTEQSETVASSEEEEEERRMTALIGNIEPFVLGEDFALYKLRLGHFLSLNKITDGKEKIDVLASFGGADLFKSLHSLVQPNGIENFTYDQLITKLENHFAPKRNEIAESFKFNKRNQKPGETIAEYVIELKSMAQSCNFGEFLDRALRDRFICGVYNESIQRKLFNDSSVTKFEKAVEIASLMEATKSDVELIQGDAVNYVSNGNRTNDSHFNKNSSTNKGSFQGQSGQRNAPRNAQTSAQHTNQSDDRIVCYACGSTGHIARFCRKRQQSNGNQHHPNSKKVDDRVHNIFEESLEQDFDFQYINSLKCSFLNKVNSGALTTVVNINDVDVRVEIDTGASGTVMQSGQFSKLSPHSKLGKSNKHFRLLSGESVEIVVGIFVNVCHKGKVHNLEITVVKASNNMLPLMGQDWLDVLFPGWREFFSTFQKEMQIENTVNKIANFDINAYRKQLCTKYKSVFSNDMFQPVKNFEAEIILKPDTPIYFHKAYSVPYGIRDKVEEELNRLVNVGILKPVKHSKRALPIVTVMKPSGEIRICVDCSRSLNKYVETEHYPLPIIEDILADLSDSKIFCVLDLTGAYQQLALAESSQELLTINTHIGLFRFTRLAFGLAPAPAMFQAKMDEILKGLANVKCYFDDVLIGGRNATECKQNLEKVLERFEEYNVRVNTAKCKFFEEKIEYLGHIIKDGCVMINEKKTEAVLQATSPKDVPQLQSFLGMMNHYSKFIPNLAAEMHILYELLQKNSHYVWTEEHETVFARCKNLLVSNNVLALYDPSKEIIIYCDASPYGVGAVLTQIFDGVEKPVYFVSSTLSPAEKNYSQVHREALALVYSVKKFHKYIYGRQFTIRTDCQALREIFSAKNMPLVAAARLQCWNVFLSMYQYKIEYKSAKCMANADGLSRLPLRGTTEIDGGCINVLKVASDFPITTSEVRIATNRDETLQRIKKYVLNGWPQKSDEDIKHYFIKRNCLATEEDCLFYGERILIPFSMRTQVLELLHDTHVGMVRMKAIARTYVYWPGIDIDIENWCKCCKACQSMQNRKDESELSSWPKTNRPFERVHIDFYALQGKSFIILVDTYSLWLEVCSMKRTTAQDVNEKLRKVFSVFGLPDEMVSDNGPPYNSKEFAHFCKMNGIKLSHSPGYSSQSNGQVEVAVRVAKAALKKMILDEKTKHNQ